MPLEGRRCGWSWGCWVSGPGWGRGAESWGTGLCSSTGLTEGRPWQVMGSQEDGARGDRGLPSSPTLSYPSIRRPWPPPYPGSCSALSHSQGLCLGAPAQVAAAALPDRVASSEHVQSVLPSARAVFPMSYPDPVNPSLYASRGFQGGIEMSQRDPHTTPSGLFNLSRLSWPHTVHMFNLGGVLHIPFTLSVFVFF